MKEQEGVIKYQLNHQNIPLDTQLSVLTINAWRSILFKLELIGQIEERYEGYGFGNISQRIDQPNPDVVQFIISGTQTGHSKVLSRQDYCKVLKADPEKNSIQSEGETKPSSEALTHASVYQQNQAIKSVVHVHCPEIWRKTHQLKIPYTNANIAYGTPEMAAEVKLLFRSSFKEPFSIFSMLGHEDGIIAFSDTMEKAVSSLILLYAQALTLEKNNKS